MINLEDVPYLITGDKFPSYYDWYAIDKGDYVEVIQTFSELCFEVNKGYAQTDKEYYWIGELKYGKILDRKIAYDLVRKYYDEYKSYFWDYGIKLVRMNVPKSLVIKKEIEGDKNDNK